MSPTQIAVVGSVIAACGLMVTAISASLAYRSLRSTHDWNRRKAAQDAALLFNQRVQGRELLEQHLAYVSSFEPVPMEILAKRFEETPNLKQAVHSLLNYFEMLARGVHQSIYDEMVINVAWKGAMTRAIDRFGPYIEERRKSSPEAWRQLEDLVSRWRGHDALISERARTG
jgi:Domain of unknown function (DUF4760)